MTSLSTLSKYSGQFTLKVIGLLLTNKQTLLNLSDSLDPEYFEDSSQKWVLEYIISYFKKYHTTPTVDVIVSECKKINNDILKLAVSETIKNSYKNIEESKDLEWVEKEFTSFCTNQAMKKAILNSVQLLEEGNYEDIKQLVNNALKVGEDKNIGHEYSKDTESRYREDDRKPIPYPWRAFNNITDGGMGKGELIMIMGNPKGGKSWCMIDIAGFAAKCGYNIVYYTLELSEGYVGKRIDAYLTGIPVDQLKNNREKVEEMLTDIPGKIIIKEFSAGRASLSSIENHLDKLNHNHNIIPDLIIIDYLDLLKNRNKGRKNVHDDIDDIYVDARGLARERGVPLLSPSQMGRAGANDDITDPTKIGGSYKKLMICDFGVGLARKRKDKINGTGKFTVLANRHGGDGMVFKATLDTSNGNIEIDEEQMIEEDDDFKEVWRDAKSIDKEDKDYLKEKFYQNKN